MEKSGESGCVESECYRIAGFFRGRKLSRISCFCADSRKFSPRKSILKQLDTTLVGVVHWVTTNSRKFCPRKSNFKQLAKVFSRERNPLYGISCRENEVEREKEGDTLDDVGLKHVCPY